MGYALKVLNLTSIEIYNDLNGNQPFVNWLESLKDCQIRYRIKERLDRVALGNFGDHKNIVRNLYELRCKFGSGFRVYYGNDAGKVILLFGGTKRTQKADINKAKRFWEDYLSR